MDAYNKIILYNDDDIKYLTGTFVQGQITPNYIDCTTCSSNKKEYIRLNTEIAGTINDFKTSETIKLDETLMRRIAKYNKEQELKQIDEQIENKKQKLKELEDLIEDRDKRVKKLKEFVAKLYDLELEDEEEYEGW